MQPLVFLLVVFGFKIAHSRGLVAFAGFGPEVGDMTLPKHSLSKILIFLDFPKTLLESVLLILKKVSYASCPYVLYFLVVK